MLTLFIPKIKKSFGREGCLFFALRGARIVALDKVLSSLEDTVSYVKGELQKNSIESNVIIGLECDVTDVTSVESAVSNAVNTFGSIDLLWNNAGYQGQIKPVLDYDPKDFALVMNINVTGICSSRSMKFNLTFFKI